MAEILNIIGVGEAIATIIGGIVALINFFFQIRDRASRLQIQAVWVGKIGLTQANPENQTNTHLLEELITKPTHPSQIASSHKDLRQVLQDMQTHILEYTVANVGSKSVTIYFVQVKSDTQKYNITKGDIGHHFQYNGRTSDVQFPCKLEPGERLHVCSQHYFNMPHATELDETTIKYGTLVITDGTGKKYKGAIEDGYPTLEQAIEARERFHG